MNGVTSIERTAYPRLERTVAAQEIHAAFIRRAEEIAWAREKTRSDAHVLALVLLQKCYQGQRSLAGGLPPIRTPAHGRIATPIVLLAMALRPLSLSRPSLDMADTAMLCSR